MKRRRQITATEARVLLALLSLPAGSTITIPKRRR
jgi:hypothetical protein